MIVIIKISLWIFFYLSILRVKNREWRDDYANTCFSLQIGLKRIRFHCMINLTWPINVQITILDIQIMFRFSRNINSNLFQLTSPIFSFIRVSLVFVAEIQCEKKRRITIIKKKRMSFYYSCLVRIKENSIFFNDRNLTWDRQNSIFHFEFSTYFFFLHSSYKIFFDKFLTKRRNSWVKRSTSAVKYISQRQTMCYSWKILFLEEKKLFTIFTRWKTLVDRPIKSVG